MFGTPTRSRHRRAPPGRTAPPLTSRTSRPATASPLVLRDVRGRSTRSGRPARAPGRRAGVGSAGTGSSVKGSQAASPNRSPVATAAPTDRSHSELSKLKLDDGADSCTSNAWNRSSATHSAPKASKASAARTRKRNHRAWISEPLEARAGTAACAIDTSNAKPSLSCDAQRVMLVKLHLQVLDQPAAHHRSASTSCSESITHTSSTELRSQGLHHSWIEECGSGPKGDRTPDLMAASHALYQLSYGPRRRAVYPAAGDCGLDLRRSAMAARPMRHPPSGSYDRRTRLTLGRRWSPGV